MYVINREDYRQASAASEVGQEVLASFNNPYMKVVAGFLTGDGLNQFLSLKFINDQANIVADQYCHDHEELEDEFPCIYGEYCEVVIPYGISEKGHLLRGDVVRAIVYDHPFNSGPYVLFEDDNGQISMMIPAGSHVFKPKEVHNEEIELGEPPRDCAPDEPLVVIKRVNREDAIDEMIERLSKEED